MKIVFFGGGEVAAIGLQTLAAALPGTIKLAITPPPQKAGRKMKLQPPPAAVCAAALGLEILHNAEDAAAAETVREQNADVLIVCDYGKILPKEILQCARRGALNVHPSLLPRWRGAAPVARAILAGDKTTGVTIMQMNEFLDAGDIVAQEQVDIANKNGGELQIELARRGAELLLRVLQNPQTFPAAAQDETAATYAKKITAAERELNFAESAELNARRVLAFTGPPSALAPPPAAHCFLFGERFKVFAASQTNLPPNFSAAPPGILLAAGRELIVSCDGGALRLETLARAGRKKMAAAELLRGLPWAEKIGAAVNKSGENSIK